MLRWQKFRSLRSQCPKAQVFFQQVGAAKESVPQTWDCQSGALGSGREGGKGLCRGEHWGLLPPQLSHKAHSSGAAELLYFHQGLLCGTLLRTPPFPSPGTDLGIAGAGCYPEPAVFVYLTAQHPRQGPVPALTEGNSFPWTPECTRAGLSAGFSLPFAFSISDHGQESPAAWSYSRLCSWARVWEQPLPFQPPPLWRRWPWPVAAPLPVGVKPLVTVVTCTNLTKNPPFASKFLLPCLKTFSLWKGPTVPH